MGHIPHVYVPGPWDSSALVLNRDTRHHLGTVLRRPSGASVTYTDGAGRIGSGELHDDAIRRGEEALEEVPHAVGVAVAPPHRSERLRFMVEKLVELGVRSIEWLESERRQARHPNADKCLRWAVGALEQSGGTWLPDIGTPVTWHELVRRPAVWVADAGAPARLPQRLDHPVTVVVGPEGGFADGEIPPGCARFTLGNTTLRTETAAIVAAASALERFDHRR